MATEKIGVFTFELKDGQRASVRTVSESDGVTVYGIDFTWTEENAKADHELKFLWHLDATDELYRWTPTCAERRFLPADWAGLGQEFSMLSKGAPLISLYNGSGKNYLTWALSECKRAVFYRSGIREEDGMLENCVRIGTAQFTDKLSAELLLRIDTRDVPFGKAISDVARWWDKEIGITPLTPPETAYDPIYSFWYSYHQDISEEKVVAECERAKALGFDICIVDDGWELDGVRRDFVYCGDWQPSRVKFPDMKRAVDRVHALGMKYMMWYSVPYMGKCAKNYEKFRSMLLYHDSEGQGVLDPRYKQVRDFLVSVYKNALTEYGLDGFKLDFIDLWEPSDRYPAANERMDIPDLSDAVDALMSEIISGIRSIKEDALVEFRQCYIGPYMRKYGYMFRVGDCPYDYLRNHEGICDLRLLHPGSAVHSDMLMWHKDMDDSLAAAQIIGVMFGTLQYSARLENMKESTVKMSKFWLSFLKEHKDLLLFGDFSAYDPQLHYTWAKSSADGQCAVGVFAQDKCVKPDGEKVIYIANGTSAKRVIAELSGNYRAEYYDCYGECSLSEERNFSGVTSLPVPIGGLAVLRRK